MDLRERLRVLENKVPLTHEEMKALCKKVWKTPDKASKVINILVKSPSWRVDEEVFLPNLDIETLRELQRLFK